MGRLVIRAVASTVRFNGATSKIVIAQNSGLPIFRTTGYSVCGRFYANVHTAAQGAMYAEASNASDNQLFHIGHQSSTRKLVITVRNNANTAQLNAVLSTTEVAQYSGWHDFVWTDNNGAAKLYIDGVQDATNFAYTPSGTYTFNTSTLGLIDRLSDASPYSGNLSDIRVFNRVLSDTEASDFHAGRPVSTSNLTALYSLDEGSGTTANDTSGNGNNGTITGGTWSTNTPMKARPAASGRVIPTKPREVVGNLLYNGNFEYAPSFVTAGNSSGLWIDGTSAGSASNSAYRWAVFARGSASNTAFFDTAEKHTGSYSMKLSVPATDTSLQVMNTPSVSALNTVEYGVPTVPGTAYTLTFWMKTTKNSGGAGTGASVDVNQRNAAGSALATSSSSAINTTTGWTQYTIGFTPPAGAVFATVKLKIDGTSGLNMDAWFDDITLTRNTPVTRQLIS